MSNVIDDVLRTNIYIQPLFFFLSILTNILNIRVLKSRPLRLSSCTQYFRAYAIFSIIYTCLLCPTQFLRGFAINWANGKLGCKIHFYILYLVPLQATLMLVFASFDRYCSSSIIYHCQSKSAIRTARLTILFGTILLIIYMLPMLFIFNWNEFNRKCLQNTNLLSQIHVLTQIVLFYILSPILMLSFGLLTIKNIHRQSLRAQPLTKSIRGRRTESQLARMLTFQIVVHLILVIPFGITYTLNTLIPSSQTPIITTICLAFVTWQQCDYFVSFFLYILSGSVYRREFIRLLRKIFSRQTSLIMMNNQIRHRTKYSIDV